MVSFTSQFGVATRNLGIVQTEHAVLAPSDRHRIFNDIETGSDIFSANH